MSLRLQRVRELLKREIGEVIRRHLPVDEVGLVNVNDVDVAPNLHNATVYVGVLGGEAQKKRAMVAWRRTASAFRVIWARPSSSNTPRTSALCWMNRSNGVIASSASWTTWRNPRPPHEIPSPNH